MFLTTLTVVTIATDRTTRIFALTLPVEKTGIFAITVPTVITGIFLIIHRVLMCAAETGIIVTHDITLTD
jgi:hypothetical protein